MYNVDRLFHRQVTCSLEGEAKGLQTCQTSICIKLNVRPSMKLLWGNLEKASYSYFIVCNQAHMTAIGFCHCIDTDGEAPSYKQVLLHNHDEAA